MVREARKVATIIYKGVNKMEHIVANIVFNLCRGRLYRVGKVEHLKAALAEDEITYHENIWDASQSTIIQGISTSNPNPYHENIWDASQSTIIQGTSTSNPNPFTRWDVIAPSHTCMDITNSFSS